MATIPALQPLPDIDSFDQQNISALQDALTSYQKAAADGIPGASTQVTNTQNALAGYGVAGLSSSGTTLPSSTLGSITGASSSTLSSVASNALSILTGGLTGGASASFTLSRAIVLILGIILFGAGLLAFKQTQTVIETGTGVVKKGAAVAAAL